MQHATVDWPNHKVEPVIITYNRSKSLERTLQSFLDAGLTTMRLHVLDNSSPDNTVDVVRRFQKQWPSLQYHRNRYNIGGNGNYVRALEIGESEYCWVIGDDDEWYFEGLDELLSVLRDGSADVIRLGWQVENDERGKQLSLHELATRQNNQFFGSVSMISSVIVRRTFITSDLSQGYLTLGDAYPQLVPFYQQYKSDQLSVYSLTRDFMKHTPSSEPGYYLADLEWVACFMRSTRHIEDRNFRRKPIHDLMCYLTLHMNRPGSWFATLRILLFYSLKSKAYGFSQVPYLFTLIGYGVGVRVPVWMATVIYFLLPNVVLQPLVRVARRRQGLSFDLAEVREHFLNGRRNRP